MGQLENLLAQLDEAQRAYNEAAERLREAKQEQRAVLDQRTKARRSADFDSYLALEEPEKRAAKTLELLVFAEKQAGMALAEAHKRAEDVRLQALGVCGSIRRRDQVLIPAIEQRIRDLEQKIEQERLQVAAEQRKRQQFVDELNKLTDLSEAELKEPVPLDQRVGRYVRSRIIARM